MDNPEEMMEFEKYLMKSNDKYYQKFFDYENEILDSILANIFKTKYKYKLIYKHPFQPKLVYKISVKDYAYVLKIFGEKRTFESETRILILIKDKNIKHSNIINYGVVKERYYVLKKYLKGKDCKNIENETEIAKEIAREIAKMNNIRVMGNLSESEEKRIISDILNETDMLEMLKTLNEDGIIDDKQKKKVLDKYYDIRKLNKDNINLCYNYSDFYGGNFIVDEVDDKVKFNGLIDFEHTLIGLVGKDIVNIKMLFHKNYINILDPYMKSYIEIKRLQEDDIYQIICQYLKVAREHEPDSIKQVKRAIKVILSFINN